MTTASVLVLGAGSPVGRGVTESLLESRWKLRVHTADSGGWAAVPEAVSGHHQLPHADHDSYEPQLVQLCRTHEIAGIFVCSHAELDLLSRRRSWFEKATGARVFVASHSLITRMSDKWELHRWLQTEGLPTVPTLPLPAPRSDIRTFCEATGFPLVLKPRHGTGSRGFSQVCSPVELEALTDSHESQILQKYVSGQEFTAGVTRARDGFIVGVLLLQRRLRSGVTWQARARPFARQREFAENVALRLGVKGPCNIQFRFHDGEPIVFDINVRWSSSTRIRSLAGVNEPSRLAAYELLDIDLPPCSYRCVDIVRGWSHTILPETNERPGP